MGVMSSFYAFTLDRVEDRELHFPGADTDEAI